MAKDPAFLFYPNDWLGGTLGMTFEEKGAYMEVLMLQFNRGHMEGHMIGQVVGHLWDKIKHKFTQDSSGLWFNERLEIEKTKRKSFTDSRKNNLKGENQYTKKVGHKEGHMTTHMENENRNENRSIFKKPTIEEIKQYCLERKNNVNPEKWFNHYESNGWKVGKNSMKDWKASIRTWENSEYNKLEHKPKKRNALL